MILISAAGDGSALRWRKSSHSDSSNPSDCVEVATASGAVHVRDSKNAAGPRFAVAGPAWADFLAYVAPR